MRVSEQLGRILRLDPRVDHQEIVRLSACYEFPFDHARALELALLRTFCVPSISALLVQTGEFLRRAQKRYDDTDLLISELVEHGYDSVRGRAALKRINRIHSRFDIPNEDRLYVLSTFVLEPLRWNARFGWRPLCRQERLASFYFWREVGRRMGIVHIPHSLEHLERFNVEYERRHFAYDPNNRRLADALSSMWLSRLPSPLRRLARQVLYAAVDEPVRAAFGWPPPVFGATAVYVLGQSLRRRLLRLVPPRLYPRLRTRLLRSTYPDGYDIARLGPEEPRESAPGKPQSTR